VDDDEIEDRWLFRTSGPNCHWCYSGKTAFVWGPYGTHICARCTALIDTGQKWEIPETLAARMTVRDRWFGLEPEHWRECELGLIAKWLTIHTTCETSTADPDAQPPAP
jgi:hypothetical protein